MTDDEEGKYVSGRGNSMCKGLLLRELLANKFIGVDHVGWWEVKGARLQNYVKDII